MFTNNMHTPSHLEIPAWSSFELAFLPYLLISKSTQKEFIFNWGGLMTDFSFNKFLIYHPIVGLIPIIYFLWLQTSNWFHPSNSINKYKIVIEWIPFCYESHDINTKSVCFNMLNSDFTVHLGYSATFFVILSLPVQTLHCSCLLI